MKLYVTYGWGYVQRNNFSVVECEEYDIGRREIFAVTNGVFASIYNEKEFEGQAERYGLTEIPLQKPDLL